MLAVKCGFHWATAAVLHRHASAEPSRAAPRPAGCMKLRTVTPPLVSQRFGTALRRQPRPSPHDFDFVALKVCVFLTNCGLPLFSARSFIVSEAPTSVLRLTRNLEPERAARGDFSGDIDRFAVVLPCCPQIGHDLVNQASCLGVVHPERGLELIGEGRRKSFANPRIRTIQAGN